MALFHNRTEAGKTLAEKLSTYKDNQNTLVFALPRGGLPIAYEIAAALNLPLDVFLVRKLGTPNHEELAMGAIALGNVTFLNKEVIDSLQINKQAIESVKNKEQEELNRRNKLYRKGMSLQPLENKTVILVDDGIATGSTIHAAIKALKKMRVKKIIIAVPLAPSDTIATLEQEVDHVYCLQQPEPFHAIGIHYDSFPQLSDEAVKSYLTPSR